MDRFHEPKIDHEPCDKESSQSAAIKDVEVMMLFSKNH